MGLGASSAPPAQSRVAGGIGDGRWMCSTCSKRISSTAGTIFQDTRTPLTIWFAASWHLTSPKSGISALAGSSASSGSAPTRPRGRCRTGFARRWCDPVASLSPVTWRSTRCSSAGLKPGKRGRGANGKVLVAIAVEQRAPKGFGRTRMAVIPDATAPTLRQFLLDNIKHGSVVLSDGFKPYPLAVGDDFTHKPFNVAGSEAPAHVPLPGVHRGSHHSPSDGCSARTRERSRLTT